jgi:competence protein ComEA
MQVGVLEGMSRTQLAVYAAIGIVLVLLGIRAVRDQPSGSSAEAAGGGSTGLSSEPVGSGGPPASNGDVVVHVAGAVDEPGVYRLPAGSRVADALERAGGANGRADPNAINLAARLADGQQVVVPVRSGSTSAAVAGAVAGATDSGPISLGSADQAALETIDGIGPVTAADILEFRDEHGGISSIEQLDEIPGIGPATIESLSDRLQP